MGSMGTGPTVDHHGMWRHPDTDNGFLGPEYYQNLGRLLEAGKLDGIFFADAQGFSDIYGGSHKASLEHGAMLPMLDPMVILSMMAGVTRNLGLGCTMSSTHIAPYHLARTLSTLDLLSKGRVAWNVVTSSSASEARNFSADPLPDRESRYDRADEVLEACHALWDGWDSDALLMDKASGRFADGTKVRAPHYRGKWVNTKGPMTVPPSPQGHPVIMQAGASERGKQFAARWAEMIFAVGTDDEAMVSFYNDVKGRMSALGRRPEGCAVMASLDLIVAETESIAREKQAYINELATAEQGLATLSFVLGVDFSTFSLDQPIADMDINEGSRGMLDVILQGSGAESMTLRQTAKHYAVLPFTPQVVGTPSQVADQLQHWFEIGGCDGFLVNPTTFPGTFEQVVRMLVPELQRRGLFRTEYRHKILRDTVLSGE
jgi:FMN-dependent oxidoreductase (nitrilotriacetate monooxygenase family)